MLTPTVQMRGSGLGDGRWFAQGHRPHWGKQGGLLSVPASSSGERAWGVRARAGGGGAPASSLPNNPHYLSHVLLLADSEQQVPDRTATITCLFEEKIGLKGPGDFSL